MEKLTICDGRDIGVYEISDKPKKKIFDYPDGCFGVMEWSPRGTYFVHTMGSYILICKSDGVDLNPIITCFHQYMGCGHVDFSPSEKYLASYTVCMGEANLIIHDVRSGTSLKEFKGRECSFLGGGKNFGGSCDNPLTVIRWSVDDEYASLIEKNALSIYAAEALSSDPLTSISNVIDFRWSPTDPFLALLQSTDGEILARVIKFPEETDVVDTKKLDKSVSNMRICWHEEKKYVAFTYKTLGEDSEILIFQIEEQTSTSFVKRKSDVFSFSFEPRGNRFAVIYGGKEDLCLEITGLNKITNNIKVI